ncbi:leucyl aminopeptidase family protein [Aureimonas leprariae]|uniref:Leucyl aminopeptidase family protein n=1 Tax=Plantimonas leprariae TaxID=2615207 RepID=A0A7V7PSZ7_9HYPH|nr:leucyl aminopeptidase family protein [Aureimonas leprariae]KAB0682701.1 leucyl aminopeptidase family protein [Aureimonas leprariae]
MVEAANGERPVWPVFADGFETLPDDVRRWCAACRFKGGAGEVLLVPDASGEVGAAVLGLGKEKQSGSAAGRSMLAGALANALPDGAWRLADGHPLDPDLASLAFRLGAYRFDRYRAKPEGDAAPTIAAGAADEAKATLVASAVHLVRDLVNTPANDFLPDATEQAARDLGAEFGAEVSSIVGDDLLAENFPMIHAVGRAGSVAPRLVDLCWGAADAPRVTLVGKGVSFDTGGLDIKPASGMLLMKKDMGGAANVLGLARILMGRKLPIRLRVLLPAVENSIAGNSFRPGDVLRSRAGRTVEIGNTDAEGRLILADALTLADEEAPDLLLDMATLTGAARVALGPDLPPFFTDDEAFAAELAEASLAVADPLWRLPLWTPYAKNLASKIADTNNVTSDGFAGSVTAALFLQAFVKQAKTWAHFDVFAWRPQAGPTGPAGGEAQCIRALHRLIETRFPPE